MSCCCLAMHDNISDAQVWQHACHQWLHATVPMLPPVMTKGKRSSMRTATVPMLI
jgi:hypothetical protein